MCHLSLAEVMHGHAMLCNANAEKNLWRMQGGAGSVLPVSVQDCEIACEMAQPECTSFSYNPTLTACFLKQGGTRATCNSPNTPCYEANQNLQVRIGLVHSYHPDSQCLFYGRLLLEPLSACIVSPTKVITALPISSLHCTSHYRRRHSTVLPIQRITYTGAGQQRSDVLITCLQVQTFSCGSWQTYFRQASTPSGPALPAVAEASGPSSPTPSPVPTPSPTPSPSPGLDGGPLGANPFTSFLGG